MAQPGPIEILDLALATIAPYGRPDLDARLRQARARLLADRVRVLVVGQFKQGKSFLVDCLVGALVCPVHDDMRHPVPTVVGHADGASVALVRPTDVRRPAAPSADRVRGPAGRARSPGTWPAPRRPASGSATSRSGIPSSILAGGLEIVDTPGVGGFNSVHGAATMAALPSADAVLLVSDASQEYTAPELEFVQQAVRICPNVACVLTKIDLYPEWRRIAEIDRAHLKQAGIIAPMFAVSSAVRWQSHRGRPTASSTPSPASRRWCASCGSSVVGQADLLARRSIVSTTCSR